MVTSMGLPAAAWSHATRGVAVETGTVAARVGLATGVLSPVGLACAPGVGEGEGVVRRAG
jgi:hypothetical protein